MKDFEIKHIEFIEITTPAGRIVKVPSLSEYYSNGKKYHRTYKYNSQGQKIWGGGDFPAPK